MRVALPGGRSEGGERVPRAVLSPFVLSLLLVALSVPAARSAEQPTEEPSASATGFSESVDVDVVEVEVRVTDRKGRPVGGLDRDDFELLIDRRPVEVKYFRPVGFGGEGLGGAAADDASARGATGQKETAAAGGGPPEQSLVLFLDEAHLTTPGRRRLVEALGPFLGRSVGAEIPVMVVSSAGGLRVLQPLTRDRHEVLTALGADARSPLGGIPEHLAQNRAVRELRQILEANADCPQGDPCDCALSQLLATASGRSSEAAGRVEETLSALDALTAALRGLPGSKTVLIASDGLDFWPGLDLYQMVADLCPIQELEVTRATRSYDLLSVYQRVTAHASANRVTFYTLDTAGIAPAGGGVDDLATETRRARRARETSLEHSLFVLADDTGGQAVFNTNRLDDRLEDLARDVSAYYSLGFTPDHPGDDRVHTIDVKVAGSHRDVRYRRAFRHLSLDGRIAERMLGTLLFGVEQNPLAVSVTVQVPAAAADHPSAGPTEDGQNVSVLVHLPLAGFTLTPRAQEAVGVSRLVMSIQDVDGDWRPIRQERVPLRLTSGQVAASAARDVSVETTLAPGEYLLAVGVRDEIGGTTSYLRKTFTVPPRI